MANDVAADGENENKGTAIEAPSNDGNNKLSGAIQVSSRQRGNPILKSVRSVPWEFVDGLAVDYVIGKKCCVFYLSLRYHTLNPNYVHERLKQSGHLGYELKILLVQVDIREPHHALRQLMRVAILSELTLMLAWSQEEAGQILETYKAFENKPPDMIMEKSNTDPHARLVETLTTVKSVNKTDAATLLQVFGTLEGIIRASIEDLTLCPGFGPHKAQRLYKALHEPFKRSST